MINGEKIIEENNVIQLMTLISLPNLANSKIVPMLTLWDFFPSIFGQERPNVMSFGTIISKLNIVILS